jgi:hypothetical protein
MGLWDSGEYIINCIVVLFTMNNEHVPIPLAMIHWTFNELGALVNRVSRSQMGDAAQLGQYQNDCHALITLVQQVLLVANTR